MTVFAGPPPATTLVPSPSEPEREPEPTARYPSLRVACDSVEALTRRALRVAVSRANGVPVDFGFGDAPRTGCELKAPGRFGPAARESSGAAGPAPNPEGDLGDWFKRAGWGSTRYEADGPDGSVMGWRSRETTCVVRWSWDGGDDSDSTYVPSDEWELVVGCVPWTAGDSRPD